MLKQNHSNMNTKLILTVSIAIGMMGNSLIANADERESLEQLKATTTNLINLLVQEGVLPKDKADAMVKKASQDAAQQVKQAKVKEAAAGDAINTAPEDKSVRVQYVPEHIKREMRAEIENEVMTKLNYKAGTRLGLPSWIDRIAFNGDIRLRYENDSFASRNALPAALNTSDRNYNVSNTTEDRNRFRVRARLGADLNVNEWLVGGLRMTTGLASDPVSPNQTQEINKGKYTIGLDRAYLKAAPYDWLTLQGGRFGNPFFNTDLMWDPDLAFDGLAASFTPKFNDTWSSFSTIGAFPVEEIQQSDTSASKSKWLYALQTGIQWKAANRSTAKLGLAYYDYENVEGQTSPVGTTSNDASVPAFRQKGNNTFDVTRLNGNSGKYALASKFKLLNATGQIDLLTYDPVHVILTGDYVKNIGFDHDEVLNRTGKDNKEETNGYQLRLDVGHNSFTSPNSNDVHKNDWSAMVAYKYLEADAVLDAFTDSDFSLGGTNAKGWILGANYAIDKNAWLSARYFSTDAISGPAIDGGYSVDVLLLDFNAKF